MPALRLPYLLLTLTALIWGGNAIAGKFAVGHVSPMILTMSRWAIAFAILGTIAQSKIRQDWPIIRKNWLYLLLMGGGGYTIFNYCLYSALQYIPAITAALEQSAMPLVVFAINFVFYKSGIKSLQIVGFTLTVIGVLVIISSGKPFEFITSSGEGFNRGDMFMLVSILAYGAYTAALRSKPDMHWQSFLASLIFAAFLVATIGAVAETMAGNAVFPTTTQGITVILYAAIFPSLVSQGLFINGNEAIGSSRAALFINLVPVFAALLAVLLLGELLHWYHAIAFILVIGGIVIAERFSEKSKR